MILPSAVITRLHKLADRARRLPPPDHRNPHAFHEARDQLGRDLVELALDVAASARAPKAPAPGNLRAFKL